MAIETLPAAPRTRTGETAPVPPHVDPVEWARFAGDVAVIPGGCHLWLGELFPDGYGRFTTRKYDPTVLGYRQIVTGAHRYAWTAHHGPLPPKEHVRRGCEDPRCTEPRHLRHTVLVRHLRCNEPLCTRADHLALGSDADNAGDRTRAGRSASRRYGIRQYGADTRPRRDRAEQLQDAVLDELGLGGHPDRLVEVVARVRAAGDVHPGQLTLPFGGRHLHLVR